MYIDFVKHIMLCTFIFSSRLDNTFRILPRVDQFKWDIDTQYYLTKIFISLKTKYSVNK